MHDRFWHVFLRGFDATATDVQTTEERGAEAMDRTDGLAWALYQERVREIETQVRRRRLLDRTEDLPAIAGGAATNRIGPRPLPATRGASTPEPA
jgi:hypothetical protein